MIQAEETDQVLGDSDSWKIKQEKDLEREKFLKIYTSLGANIDPEPGQNFLVLVYLLQNPPHDGVHGSMFPVAVYSTRQQAERKSAQLCSRHHVDSVRIYLMTDWNDINEKCPIGRVKYATSDSNLVSLQDINHQKKVDQYKEEVKLRDQIEEEHLRSDKSGTIEHYQYSWYRAVKHKSKIEYLQRQLTETEKSYQKSIEAIREDFKLKPSLDQSWLPDLETKLVKRKEEDVYNAIVSGYTKLRDEILEIGKNKEQGKD
uniref:Uncharacterized protein n=1 Tax=Pithovirus LCPAC201 TaxID=2506591 RepID=A0A481Z6J1_9VIRU|nr:MAG: uncharacterized protein LCPAC201_00110 [Pithovirus LCPAC201]